MPQIDKCIIQDAVSICSKQRCENTHICVDMIDNYVLLAVCNAQENCARSTIIHPYQGYETSKLAEEVMRVLKRSSLGAQIEFGLSGECQKTLQAAQGLTHISRLKKVKLIKPSIIRRSNIVPKPTFDSNELTSIEEINFFSKRFPSTLDWSRQKEKEGVYRVLLMLRGSERLLIEKNGTFVIKTLAQLLTSAANRLGKIDPLWWQSGWDQLLAMRPRIVEHTPEGMRIHLVRLSSNCLNNMQLPLSKRQSQETRLPKPSVVEGKIEYVPAKRTNLPPQELKVFDVLVQSANGEEGSEWLVEKYISLLKEKLPTDFERRLINRSINKLKEKSLIREAGRGNLMVICLWPVEENHSSNKDCSQTPKKEKSMSTKYSPLPKGVALTNKEKEMLRELLKMASDKISARVTIPNFTKALIDSPYSGDKANTISVTASSLRTKGVALPADRKNKEKKGVIEILRLHPDELKATTKKSGKPAKKKAVSGKSGGKGKGLATAQEELENCSQKGGNKEGCCGRHHGKDSFCDQMIAIMDKVDDLETLSDELLSNLDKKKLRILHTLLSLADKIRNNEDCPQFEEVDDRTKVSFMLD